MANNPILYPDFLGDSIPTLFYNEQGQQINTIPAQVQQMFNNEYGIQAGYNAATNMMYLDQFVSTDLPVSPDGLDALLAVMCSENDETIMIFGHNLGVKEKGEIGYSAVPLGMHVRNSSVALIDLADYDSNGNPLGAYTTNNHNPRSSNMARTFEHEYFGHGVKGFKENETVTYVNENFRKDAGIQLRNGYGGTRELYKLRQSLKSNNLTESDRSKRFFKNTNMYTIVVAITYGVKNRDLSFVYYTQASRKSASVTVIKKRINADKIRKQWRK